MHESTLKKLRLLPVGLAALLTVGVSWLLLRPERTVLVFATGSEVGLYHRLATHIKEVVEDAHPDISIALKTSAGSQDNLGRIDRGEAHLALAQNDTKGGTSVRSVVSLYPEVLHLLCRSSANISSLSDLSGRRIGIGAAGSGTEQLTSSLLRFAGVDVDPTLTTRGTFSESLNDLRSGRLDAAFVLTGLGSAVVRETMRDESITLAPIRVATLEDSDPDSAARTFTEGFRVHYPYIAPHVVPLMAYGGRPAKPLPSVSVQAVFVCQQKVGAETVERITRTLFERRAVLAEKDPAFTHMTEQNAQTPLQFPLHTGADHYFRRTEPGFLSRHAELMGFVVTVLLLAWSILAWVRRWYMQHRKNRVDTYYRAVADLSNRVNDAKSLEEIDALESELRSVGRRAGAELVQETLAADESYVIYQNMFSACLALIQHARSEAPQIPDTPT